MISKESLERLDIKVVSKIGNEFSCLCPMHSDTKPSLFINEETELFHCFAGCLKGRGYHQLYNQVTGKSLKGNPVIIKTKRREKITPSIPVLPLAINNPGEEYLNNRKFNSEIIKNWGLMYWAKENAIVIPIPQVGFILRYIKSDVYKYKYVPGTDITSTLFGLDKFKDNSYVILVEGAFDCIWLHQLGYTNCLAILHSGVSGKQLKLLQGLTNEVYLMLDNDKGGVNAARQIYNTLKLFFIVKECHLPEEKDPNDCDKNTIQQSISEAKFFGQGFIKNTAKTIINNNKTTIITEEN